MSVDVLGGQEPGAGRKQGDTKTPETTDLIDTLDAAEEKHPSEEATADSDEEERPAWLRYLKTLDEIVSPILKALLLVSLIFGVLQYLQVRENERVTQSLQYVSLWDSDDFRRDLNAINAALAPSFQASRPQIDDARDDPELVDGMLANLGDRLTGADLTFNTRLEAKIERIFYFFDRAAICAEVAICQYDVLRSFLGEEATAFWKYFSMYARRKRDAGYTGYGHWTERFALGTITAPRFWIIF